MATTLIYLSASLLVFLILTEIVTVTFIYNKFWMAKINFMIFAVQLSETDKSQVTKRSNEKKGKKSTLLNLYKPFLRLIRASDIYIPSVSLAIKAENPITYALLRSSYFSFISAGFAALSSVSRNFEHGNIIITNSEHNKSEVALDARIKCSLLSFLRFCISLIISTRKGK